VLGVRLRFFYLHHIYSSPAVLMMIISLSCQIWGPGPVLLMNTTKTAAYAAVAASKFSGKAFENRATAKENRKIETETTVNALNDTLAVPTSMINTGVTSAKPPSIAKANR
jgi:hypothetical protein